MTAKRRRDKELANKTGACVRLGWTRSEFDRFAREGMPVVRRAEHKGREWLVDLAEVRRWLEGRRREAARRRRDAEERRREALEREAIRAREGREDTRRWLAEQRRRNQETYARDAAYRVCRSLACEDLGFPWASAMPADVAARFREDWPEGPPAWWECPPGMLAAMVGAAYSDAPGGPYPDWRGFWPEPHHPGRPWPWRRAA
jgi:hypothetical protein